MDDDKTRKRCVGTPVPGCPQIPSRREAHLHFLHQKHPPKRKNRKHILTDFSERMCFLAFSLGIRDGKPVLYILGSKAGCLPSYFRLSPTATARSTVMPTMGEQCEALRVEILATCRWQVATLPMGAEIFRIYYFRDSSTATATDTVIPTMGLLPAPRKPIISTWAGTEEEPANWASLCIRPMVSVMP